MLAINNGITMSKDIEFEREISEYNEKHKKANSQKKVESQTEQQVNFIGYIFAVLDKASSK